MEVAYLQKPYNRNEAENHLHLWWGITAITTSKQTESIGRREPERDYQERNF